MNWRDRSPYRKYIKTKRGSEQKHTKNTKTEIGKKDTDQQQHREFGRQRKK